MTLRPGKQQNLLLLSGWIIDHTWPQARPDEERALAITLRSDSQFHGGHHRVLLCGVLAEETQAVLDIMEARRQQQQLKRPLACELDLVRVSIDQMSQVFPEVTVVAHMDGDRAVGDQVTYLNLPAQLRALAQQHRARLQGTLPPRAAVDPMERPGQ